MMKMIKKKVTINFEENRTNDSNKKIIDENVNDSEDETKKIKLKENNDNDES